MSDCGPHSVRASKVGRFTVAAPNCLFVEMPPSCVPFPLVLDSSVMHLLSTYWEIERLTNRRWLVFLKPETKEKISLNCSNCETERNVALAVCDFYGSSSFHHDIWVIAIMIWGRRWLTGNSSFNALYFCAHHVALTRSWTVLCLLWADTGSDQRPLRAVI